MATNTTNYSFKKPDESDFYDVQDQNGNWDMADEALKSLDTPTFEDYTGSTPVPAANTAIDGIKSKTKLSALMSNIKAAFKGACLIGHIVNNCVTNNPNLPLSAAQGKVLMDLYTRLNGDLYKWLNVTRLDTGNDVNDLPSPSLAYSYSTASHAPFDGISANILTIGIDGYKAQIAFGVSRDSVQVKVRTSYDFVWQGWRSVTLS
ncbi:hypothetical protein [[Clostridium] symbiosum]|jgi:hypothetical protein|uniref:hypothetical protein n=1 Tax=Clostridium symbiosum TaxID=1512 RepID=UPI0025A4A5CD|nr:hypothetical protein [[Clostridium] symbiosum]MDM8134017.1 hypothetical protein [[Clostridium] symbiosum]